MSAGPEIQSHVALEERQALNLHMPDPTTNKALYQERDHSSAPRSGRGAGGTAERHFLVSHWAALHGFINVLEHLFASNNNGADTTAINKHKNFLTVVSDVGLLPVHYAARGGQLEAMRMLLSQASVVTGLEYTTAGNTIATLAAQFGHVHILEWLNESITLRPLLWTGELTRQGRTPLHCGAQAGAVGVVQLYLNMHAVSSSSILMNVVAGNEGAVEERRFDSCDLHGHTYELLYNQTCHHDDADGRTNNLKSCCSGMLRDVDNQGATLMHHAARHPPANNSIVAFLHQKVGLSLFEKDASGNSPAVWTVLGGKNYKHILCLRYMLEKNRGETLSTRTGEGQPLLTLVRGKHGTECSMFSEMRGMGFVEE
ncbi:Hypothetical protein, putative [Bodo saltans]|uniref:Uncharacterized protein n=1 Tax=Bodo saltans TaxID=75058 RepID=A0A0S4IPD3_BODSA|nr:Hypothetical protein, putative [Bodo saltans]|eukprot:CUE67333.1 Hypothetical protein, putative [Bodo saltans]